MYSIVSAKYLESYKIALKFEDDSEGIVDLTEYHSKKGLFEPLKDIDFFKEFYIDKELGTIVWSNGLDIAPDTLYIKATGRYPNGLQRNS